MRALVEKNNNLLSTSPAQDARQDGRVFSFDISEQLGITSLIYSVFLFIPLCLFTFRVADNNRLLSWAWSISWSQLLLMLGALSVLLLVVAYLARTTIDEQKSIFLLPALAMTAVIPFWQQPEIIIDHSRYFSQAKFLELYGISYFFQEWGRGIFAWTDLPLIPFIYGVAFQWFGEHRYIIQLLNSLFLSGAVLITYLLGRNLWSHENGLLAAFLLMGIPYLFNQVPLMLVDIPAMFFLSLALLASLRAVTKGGLVNVVFATTAIGLAMLSKYSIWLMLSVLPMLFFVANKNKGIGVEVVARRLAAVASGVLVLAVLVGVWKFDVIRQQLQFLFDYQWSGLSRWHESNISSYLFHIYPLVTVLALASVVHAYRKRDYRFIVIAWLPLLLLVLEVKRMRYLIPVLPLLALMAAYALVELKNVYHRRYIAIGTMASAVLIAMTMNVGFAQNSSAINVKLAGAYLDTTNYNVIDMVVLPQHISVVNPLLAVSSLDYYTQKTVFHDHANQLRPNRLPPNASTSSVRFSWEYKLPAYYNEFNGRDFDQRRAIVVLYSDSSQLASQKLEKLLADYRLTAEFDTTDRVFKYQTLVNIYEPR